MVMLVCEGDVIRARRQHWSLFPGASIVLIAAASSRLYKHLPEQRERRRGRVPDPIKPLGATESRVFGSYA